MKTTVKTTEQDVMEVLVDYYAHADSHDEWVFGLVYAEDPFGGATTGFARAMGNGIQKEIKEKLGSFFSEDSMTGYFPTAEDLMDAYDLRDENNALSSHLIKTVPMVSKVWIAKDTAKLAEALHHFGKGNRTEVYFFQCGWSFALPSSHFVQVNNIGFTLSQLLQHNTVERDTHTI